MSTEEILEKATGLMMKLASDETEHALLDARTKVQQSQRILLLDSGQILLKQAKGEQVDAERRSLMNDALNLVECYLMSLECAVEKCRFLRQLLDPQTDASLVQEAVPYQQMLEELLFVQSKRAEKLLRDQSGVRHLVQENVFASLLRPFLECCVSFRRGRLTDLMSFS